MQTRRGRVRRIPGPWKAGKEFGFCPQIKGVTFGLSWYHDLTCTLNVHSRVCIKCVWGLTQGQGLGRCSRAPHLEFHLGPKVTHP